MLGARGIYFGGYPWRDLGILTADDLNAAVALALQEPSSLAPETILGSIPDGSLSNSKLMNPYIRIGSTQIPLGPSNITTLTGLSPPINPSDVATKYYVDNVVGLEGYTAGVGLTLIGNQFNIAQTGVVAATYGSATQIPQITVNTQGQITHAGAVLLSIAASQISNGTTGSGQVVLNTSPTFQGGVAFNGNVNIPASSLTVGGNVTVASNFYVGGSGGSPQMNMGTSPSQTILSFSNGWYWSWNAANGDLAWITPSGLVTRIDGGGSIFVNGITANGGSVAGIFNAGAGTTGGVTMVNGTVSAQGAVNAVGNVTGQNIGAAGQVTALSGGIIVGRSDLAIIPYGDNLGSVGVSGQAWWQVNGYNIIQASDPSVKTDIAPLRDGALDLTDKIHPISFKWKTGQETDNTHCGFDAVEVNKILGDGTAPPSSDPEFEHLHGVCVNELVAVLWKGVQELSARVRMLEGRNSR